MDGEFTAESVAAGLVKVSNDIKREVGLLIPVAADRMIGLLAGRYPIGRKDHPDRPHMREDMYVRTLSSQDHLLPVRRVVGPRLAYIWQDGTTQRYDATRKNANRGRMPAFAPGFFQRTAVAVRGQMLQQAQGILDTPRPVEAISGGTGGSLL